MERQDVQSVNWKRLTWLAVVLWIVVNGNPLTGMLGGGQPPTTGMMGTMPPPPAIGMTDRVRFPLQAETQEIFSARVVLQVEGTKPTGGIVFIHFGSDIVCSGSTGTPFIRALLTRDGQTLRLTLSETDFRRLTR